MKLYHYVHCPFCVRVRLALGFLQIEYTSIVLQYDDESTPVKLSGKKMLPILEDNSLVLNESLDIIKHIDTKNKLNTTTILKHQLSELTEFTNLIGKSIHSLAMPYWMWTPEFTESSRLYFQNKKEMSRGPFKLLVQNKESYICEVEKYLKQLETKLMPFYKSDKLTLADIILGAHLWGLYIVPEYQFPRLINDYLQSISKLCRFNYHEDFWR